MEIKVFNTENFKRHVWGFIYRDYYHISKFTFTYFWINNIFIWFINSEKKNFSILPLSLSIISFCRSCLLLYNCSKYPPMHQEVQFPVGTNALVAGFIPSEVPMGGNWSMLMFLSFLLPSSLSKTNKNYF